MVAQVGLSPCWELLTHQSLGRAGGSSVVAGRWAEALGGSMPGVLQPPGSICDVLCCAGMIATGGLAPHRVRGVIDHLA